MRNRRLLHGRHIFILSGRTRAFSPAYGDADGAAPTPSRDGVAGRLKTRCWPGRAAAKLAKPGAPRTGTRLAVAPPLCRRSLMPAPLVCHFRRRSAGTTAGSGARPSRPPRGRSRAPAGARRIIWRSGGGRAAAKLAKPGAPPSLNCGRCRGRNRDRISMSSRARNPCFSSLGIRSIQADGAISNTITTTMEDRGASAARRDGSPYLG